MTKNEIYEAAFQCGRDNNLSAGGMPKDWHQYSTEEWDAFETWHEGWYSGREYALNAERETVFWGDDGDDYDY